MSGAFEYKPNYIKKEEIIKGYEKKSEEKIEILRLAGIAMVMIFVTWLHILQPKWLENISIIITVIVCGYPLYRESLSSLKKGRVNMELSMVIAIVASLILLQFLLAIAITFFALVSEFIEGFIVRKGRKNIEGLYRYTPRKAIVKRRNDHEDEQENLTTQEIPISKVIVGDIVIVREGDILIYPLIFWLGYRNVSSWYWNGSRVSYTTCSNKRYCSSKMEGNVFRCL